jgi:guanylate kinase
MNFDQSKINLENPIVCLITGPAGAGKSTVSRALAEKFEKSAVINADDLQKMIVKGRVKLYPWNEEVKQQLFLRTQNACTLANNFLELGYNVIIDCIVGRTHLKQYQDFFYNRKIKVFLLLPNMDALLDRFDKRENNYELRIRTQELHDKFISIKDEVDWLVIDSSNQTVEKTTNQIFEELIK